MRAFVRCLAHSRPQHPLPFPSPITGHRPKNTGYWSENGFVKCSLFPGRLGIGRLCPAGVSGHDCLCLCALSAWKGSVRAAPSPTVVLVGLWA